ncbi:MAG: DUF3806 domain-containing protein [Candidatus Hydrogenedentes bacterium]|nr:DUF3806 domain-containing protein [Candidatus Hydrogenedentota bacterium]
MASEQRFEKLNQHDLAEIEVRRALVRSWIAHNPDLVRALDTIAGRLLFIDSVISQQLLSAEMVYEWQCLGIIFGDALADRLGLEWQVVEEEGFRDPCLVAPGTTIVLFPMTMLSKRIEQGDNIDLHHFFDGLCEQVTAMRKGGAFDME